MPSLLYKPGGSVVHSYGRLIPHEFPITDLQQISGPDGIGRITCTVSSGTADFRANGGVIETGGLAQTKNDTTAILVVKTSNVSSFLNRDLFCTNVAANFLYLFISSASKYIYMTYKVYNWETYLYIYVPAYQFVQTLASSRTIILCCCTYITVECTYIQSAIEKAWLTVCMSL